MSPLIKDGSATFEQAMDLTRRREFDKAQEKFLTASQKYLGEGSIPGSNRARAYAELVSSSIRRSNPAALMALAGYLTATLGDEELRPGPRGIRAADLARQLELTARDSNLMSAVQVGTSTPEALAQALQGLANDYRPLADEILFLPELFDRRSITVHSRIPTLMALSFEVLGTAIETRDPLTAAQHFQTAQQYWTQAGDEARARAASTRVGGLALQARCWFCGREGTGHGIQFVSLPISQDVTGLKDSAVSPLPSLDRSGQLVFVCKGCHSAVYGLADRIALQRSAESEARLDARIRSLEYRVNRMSSAGGHSR